MARGATVCSGLRRIDLGLDVEAHGPVAALLDQREDVGEPRDALAVHGLLLREWRGVFAPRPDAADVVLLELLVRQRRRAPRPASSRNLPVRRRA